MVWIYDFPKNLYQLTPIEANVPRIVATIAEETATIILFNKEFHNGFESKINFWYQINEAAEKVESFDSLKE